MQSNNQFDLADLGGKRISNAGEFDLSDLGGKRLPSKTLTVPDEPKSWVPPKVLPSAGPTEWQRDRDQGPVGKAWDFLNTGLISGDTLVRAMSGRTREQLNEDLSPFEGETPIHAGFREFTRGAIGDIGDTASGFTSPVAIATQAAGAYVKAFQAYQGMTKALAVAEGAGNANAAASIKASMGALVKAFPQVFDPRLAKAVTGLGKVAALGFGAQGAGDIYDAGLENTPEAWRKRLAGGSMLANAEVADLGMGGARLAKNKLANWHAAREANSYTPHETARIKIGQQLNQDASFHPTLDAAMPEIAKAAGGVDKITGIAPRGTAQRLADATTQAAKERHATTKALYLDPYANEPVPIDPDIVPNLKAVATRNFRIADKDTAALIDKALLTRELTVKEAYELKSRLNSIAEPAYQTAIGERGAPSPVIAKGAAQNLQGKLGTMLGPEYLESDRMQGKVAAVRNEAIDTANAAGGSIQKESQPISAYEAGAGVHRPTYAVAHAVVRKAFETSKHPDVVLHKALKDYQFGDPLQSKPPTGTLTVPPVAPAAPMAPTQSIPPPPEAALFDVNEMMGPPVPTPEQTLAARQRLGHFGFPERGVAHADGPTLDSPVAPSAPKIYEPPAQRLGDRGIPETPPDANLENKIAYDATRSDKLTREGWTPPAQLFRGSRDPVRFENPETGGLETWQLREGKPVLLSERHATPQGTIPPPPSSRVTPPYTAAAAPEQSPLPLSGVLPERTAPSLAPVSRPVGSLGLTGEAPSPTPPNHAPTGPRDLALRPPPGETPAATNLGTEQLPVPPARATPTLAPASAPLARPSEAPPAETQVAGPAEGERPAGARVVLGSMAPVKTAAGSKLQTQYAVVEADDVSTSHTPGANEYDLRENPNYPSDLQPRDRTKVASGQQVNGIMQNLDPEELGANYKASDGAPITGEDLHVESGNARTIALKELYRKGHANGQSYKSWLTENAGRFGLDPQQFAGMKEPILIRIRKTPVANRRQFAIDANERAQAAMGAGEQARVDAERLTPEIMSIFDPGESGDLMAASNRPFTQRFVDSVVPASERGDMMTREGTSSQALLRRMQNALFQRAYGSPEVLERMAESPDNNIKSITNALTQAAPRIADMRAAIEGRKISDVDLGPDLRDASRELLAIRDAGKSVDEFLGARLPGQEIPPITEALLRSFEEFKRRPKVLAEVLRNYADLADQTPSPDQGSLLGPQEPPAKIDLLNKAIEKARSENVPPSLLEKFTQAGDNAAKRLEDRGTFKGNRLMSGIPLDDLADYAIVGAAKIAMGIKDFASWSASMVRQFGEHIKPHLNALYADAYHRSGLKMPKEEAQPSLFGSPEPPKKTGPEQLPMMMPGMGRTLEDADRISGETRAQEKALAERDRQRGTLPLPPR